MDEMAQQAKECLELQKQFQKLYLKQQNKALKLKAKAEESSKKAQQIEMLKMALSVNQDDPAKMQIYWNQLDLLILGMDPNATLHQTQNYSDDEDNNSDSEKSTTSQQSHASWFIKKGLPVPNCLLWRPASR